MQTLGEKMRDAITRQMSLEAAAERSGVDRRLLGKYIANQSVPKIPNAIRLADAAGITLDELVGRQPPNESPATVAEEGLAAGANELPGGEPAQPPAEKPQRKQGRSK